MPDSQLDIHALIGLPRFSNDQIGILPVTIADSTNSFLSGNFGDLPDIGYIKCTADPLTNAAGGDYSLNNTAGGGALLRAAAPDLARHIAVKSMVLVSRARM